MRLATIFDSESHTFRPVFELPGGEQVDLRELFRAPGVAEQLDAMPCYFTDLAKTVAHMEDVVEAVRAWSLERSENPAQREDLARRFLAHERAFASPIVSPRNVREFDAFEEHARRQSLTRKLPLAWHDAPQFNFVNSASLVGHDAQVVAPIGCRELDFGLQLGLIIGRGGRNIGEAEAWKHVAGFTIVNAFSAVDFRSREQGMGLGASKSRDFATAVGPYLVTLDALRDRLDSSGRMHLTMSSRVNGTEVGRNNSSAMSFAWPSMVAQASADADLFSGDLLLSGTITGGCLADYSAGPLLSNGDIVELDIERLGTLRNTVCGLPRSTRREDHHPEIASAV